ncbi:MAG: hypothetical protein MJ240_11685, partial [Kiritimatiellae bacterium]|nr:hypothetical protein [Kiritimatiellia bacterium]
MTKSIRFLLAAMGAASCACAGDMDMIVDPARPLGLVVYDVGDYVQDGLVAHFDGIRNAGSMAAHDRTATSWANLVPNGAPAVFQYHTGTTADAVGEGWWTGKGYYFDAKSYAVMSEALYLPANFTVQMVADFKVDEQPDLSGYYPNYLSNPDDFGFFASPGSRTSLSTVYWKVDPEGFPYSQSMARPRITSWKGKYFSAGMDDEHVYISEDTVWSTGSNNYKSRTVLHEIGPLKWSWGGSATSALRAATRYSRGEVHAVRFYNRLLTEDELAHNRLVDEARFRQAPPETNAVVATSIGNVLGFPTGMFAVNGTHTFTGPGNFTQDGIDYATVGYTLERWDMDAAKWLAVTSSDEMSYAYTNCVACPRVRLIWQVESVGGVRQYDAAHYVTNGLVLHFDGILNEGLDQPHNAAATTWKNLVPNGVDAEHADASDAGDVELGHWVDNGYYFAGSEWWELLKTVTPGPVGMFQAVTTYDSHDQIRAYPSVFGGGGDIFNFYTYTNNVNPTLYFKTVIAGRTSTPSWQGQYLSACLDYTEIAVAQNDQPLGRRIGGNSFTGALAPSQFYIGGVPIGTTFYNYVARSMVGTIHAIRLYNRRLNAGELAWNRELDDLRFRGIIPTSPNIVEVAACNPEGASAEDGYYKLYGAHAFTRPEVMRVGNNYWVCDGARIEIWDEAAQAYGEPIVRQGTSQMLEPSAVRRRITWLWRAPHDLRQAGDFRVRDYVQEGLVAHYDGIRNVGEMLPHENAAEKWVDLVAGNTMSLFGDDITSGEWRADGYAVHQMSCWEMDAPVTVGLALTVQAVMDIDFASQTNTYPNYFGISTDNGLFSRTNDNYLTWKFDKWGSESGSGRVNLSKWDGRYISLGCDETKMYITQSTSWSTSKNRRVFEEVGGNTWSVGGAQGTYRSSRYSEGVYKSFRLYDRLLTEEELAWNRMVDRARFDGVLTRTNVLVATSQPVAHGVEAEGTYVVKEEWNFSSATIAQQGKRTYVLDGYTLETLDNGVWSAPVFVKGTNYVHQTAVQPAPVRLT